MEIQQIQQMLALVSLLMGGLLIGIIYNAYRIVKQQTLLYFIYGLFTLIVGIAFADIVSILTPDRIRRPLVDGLLPPGGDHRPRRDDLRRLARLICDRESRLRRTGSS